MRMFSTCFRYRMAAPVLGFTLIAGSSAPVSAQPRQDQVRVEDQGASARSGETEPGSRVFSANAPPPMLTDEARARNDPDFAWRKTWSEAPYWGGRVGYVDRDGVLRVHLRYAPPGSKSAGWVVVAKGVADFQLMDWRIAVRKTDGSLWFANGQLSEPLHKIDDHVAAYQMSLIDIGTLSTEGAFRYSAGGPARTIATGVRAFQMQHTGRIGVLGNDGSLWLFEGGRPQGDAFRQVATRVKTFQLEREWVGYIEEGPQARLMVGKGDVFGGEPLVFVAVASGIEDFESEISVEMREGFPGRLRVAAVGKGGDIVFGEAAEPAKIAVAPVGTGAREVHWAGGQLAVLSQGGNLRIGALSAAGQFEGFEDHGHAEGFRLTVERALLVARTPNKISIVNPRLVEEPVPEGVDKDGHPLGKSMAIEGLDVGSERYLVDGKNGETPFATAFELSSIRPAFQRRAMTAPVAPKGELAPLSFSSN